jgi:hypothetical protein
MASVMVWWASGLKEPSDMAEAMKRLTMVGAVSTWSSANGAAAGRISNRSRKTVGLLSTARVPKAFQA